MLPILESQRGKALEAFLTRRRTRLVEAERVAAQILKEVQQRGDQALRHYTRRLDGIELDEIGWVVTKKEIRKAYGEVSPEVVQAFQTAGRHIRQVARQQLPAAWRLQIEPGVVISQLVRPLERVACYVPGGRFPLPSTVLMSVIPARVAGVKEIFLACPRPSPPVLVAADLVGVKKIFRLGGAQALAAFAFGTQRVPRVDKIVGPGNRYVAAAKKLLAGSCGVDFVAGPTELVILATRGNARWLAADLVAQAEHDPDALLLLLTPSRHLAHQVQNEVHRLLEVLPARVAAQALRRHGAVIVTQSTQESLEIANRIAPEHLAIVDGARQLVPGLQAAGSVFLGPFSAVAAGDYASGTNHILPTGGGARLRGGLSAADFVRTISVQRLSRAGLVQLGATVTTLARAEGLEAHARSVEVRLENHG